MDYKRALFIRFGGLGDILLVTPSIRALHKAFPGIEIDFVVGGGMAEALIGHPLVSNVIVFNKRGIDSRLDRFVPFLNRLSQQRYDLVINLHPSAKSVLMTIATNAPERLFFRKQSTVDPVTGRVTHAIEDFAKELQAIGIERLDDTYLDFIIPDEARARISDILRFSRVAGDRLVVINPAASRPVNRWPLGRFKQVAAHFAAQRGTSVIITGAPPTFRTEMDKLDEVGLADEIASADERIVNLAGRITVKELGALLEQASVLLTCDTGPMHIGGAVGVPMVVLTGATDPNRTGPRVPTAMILADKTLSCVPCRGRICARGDLMCMSNITLDAVVDAVQRQIYTAERVDRGVVLPVIQ